MGSGARFPHLDFRRHLLIVFNKQLQGYALARAGRIKEALQLQGNVNDAVDKVTGGRMLANNLIPVINFLLS